MVVVDWWVQLLTHGFFGAIAALWLAGVVLPLGVLAAIELGSFLTGLFRAAATSRKPSVE